MKDYASDAAGMALEGFQARHLQNESIKRRLTREQNRIANEVKEVISRSDSFAADTAGSLLKNWHGKRQATRKAQLSLFARA